MSDFFERQARAQASTKLLIAYFVLAVLLIVGAVYGVIAFAFHSSVTRDYSGRHHHRSSMPPRGEENYWDFVLFLWVSGGVISVIGLGSAYKISQLSSGGASVAELLGGRRLVGLGKGNPKEQRLQNVVEEMSIASGVPVPDVYVFDGEEGINAFAAGNSPSDAVIGITRGALEKLNRDQLQGVIAHEYSHILHGDMTLNMRLMGVVHGILLISLIGYWMMRSVEHVRLSNRKNGGGFIVAMILLGVAFYVIGSVGVFFGRLIKAAVSRQREFLADASAVQFTRNPGGLAGALRVIGGWMSGGRFTNPHAEEASHFFFANGLTESWFNLFATHPPLEERIQAIEGESSRLEPVQFTSMEPVLSGEEKEGVSSLAPSSTVRSDLVLERVGQLTGDQMVRASALRSAIPDALINAARDPVDAQSLVYAILLQRNGGGESALSLLEEQMGGTIARQTGLLLEIIRKEQDLPAISIVDLALGGLKKLSASQAQSFLRMMRSLVLLDGRIDSFEYVLECMMRRHVEIALGLVPAPGIRYHSLARLIPDAEVLFSMLAHCSGENALAAFEYGKKEMPDFGRIALRPLSECSLERLEDALRRLAEAGYGTRKRILDVCVRIVQSDGMVKAEEFELLRGVGDSLGCPVAI